MIAQLVRTRFESNLMAFGVFVALIVAAGIRYAVTAEESQGPVSRDALLFAAAWLVLSAFAAGIVSLLRQTRERSSRLYAQLPVTALQIRIAYWLHVGIYPAMVGLSLLAFVQFAGTEPAPVEFRLVTLGLFLSMSIWLACLSLVTGNVSRVIPEKVRKNAVLYFFVVTVATLVLGYGLILVAAAFSGAFRGATDLEDAVLVMGIICAALVALDIYLFAKKDRSFD